MSRPELGKGRLPYWEAFIYLEDDRDEISHSMGMAGAVMLPARIRRSEIRHEGIRRGYRAGNLEDFIDIVSGFDRHRVHAVRTKLISEFLRDLKTKKRPPGRGR